MRAAFVLILSTLMLFPAIGSASTSQEIRPTIGQTQGISAAEAGFLSALAALPEDDGMRALGRVAYLKILAIRMVDLACRDEITPARPGWRGAFRYLRTLHEMTADDVSGMLDRARPDVLGIDWASGRLSAVLASADALGAQVAAANGDGAAPDAFTALHVAARRHLDEIMLFSRQLAGLGLRSGSEGIVELVSAAVVFEREMAHAEEAALGCIARLARGSES